MKHCPFCDEEIKDRAVLCKHCRHEVYPGTCLSPGCGARNTPGAPYCETCNGFDLIPPWEPLETGANQKRSTAGIPRAVAALAAGLCALAFAAFQMLRPAQRPTAAPRTPPPVQVASAWLHGTPLPIPLYLHSMVHANGRLYSIGGISTEGRHLADVFFSELSSEGLPGPWTSTTPLPQASSTHRAEFLDGRIYAVGGDPVPGGVRYAPVRPDGTIVAWGNGPALPVPLFNNLLAAVPGHLFSIGGQTAENEARPEVYHSAIDARTGAPGAWGADRPLPGAVTTAAAAVIGRRIYVLGGSTDARTAATPLVWSAEMGEDGTLSVWRKEADLPFGLREGRAVALEGRLYFLGGLLRSGSRNASVFSAVPDAEGRLRAWQVEQPLPVPNAYLGAAAAKSGLYLSGGAPGSQPVSDVLFLPARSVRQGP